MLVNLCYACRRINAPTALRCDACGRDLDDLDTWPTPLSRHAEPTNDAALWLSDLGAAPGLPAPALDISLRDLDVPNAYAASAPPAPETLPLWEMLADEQAPGPAPAALAAAVNGAARTSLDVDPAARAAWKVARRGGVRRSRLARTSPPASDVLVFDPDDTARHQLCTLLRAFGFNVRSAAGVIEAAALAADRGLVAAFVDVALDGRDGGGGLDLVRHLRAAAPQPGTNAALLVLVAAQLRPVDRVRAELAGFDELLDKPVNRGSVARVLDSHGIALPSDARRARP